MADVKNDSFSSKDLNNNVDVFKDVPDAPRHPDDNYDPMAHLAEIKKLAEADGSDG